MTERIKSSFVDNALTVVWSLTLYIASAVYEFNTLMYSVHDAADRIKFSRQHPQIRSVYQGVYSIGSLGSQLLYVFSP